MVLPATQELLSAQRQAAGGGVGGRRSRGSGRALAAGNWWCNLAGVHRSQPVRHSLTKTGVAPPHKLHTRIRYTWYEPGNFTKYQSLNSWQT